MKTKRISPNSRAKSSTLCSIFQPKCPKRRPAKSTPALPNPMPRILIVAIAKPAIETTQSTRIACAIAFVFSSASSQLIGSLYHAGSLSPPSVKIVIESDRDHKKVALTAALP